MPVSFSSQATNSGEQKSLATAWRCGVPAVRLDVAVLGLVDVEIALPERVLDTGELVDGLLEGGRREDVVEDDVGERVGLTVGLGPARQGGRETRVVDQLALRHAGSVPCSSTVTPVATTRSSQGARERRAVALLAVVPMLMPAACSGTTSHRAPPGRGRPALPPRARARALRHPLRRPRIQIASTSSNAVTFPEITVDDIALTDTVGSHDDLAGA